MKKFFMLALAALLVVAFVASFTSAGLGKEHAFNDNNKGSSPDYIEEKELDEDKMEEHSIRVLLNGREVEFDLPPVYCDGRLKVPGRTLLEKIGAEVGWDEETRSVIVEKENTVAYFRIWDELLIEVNGEMHETEYLPSIVNGVTMLPLELLVEIFECELYWEEEGNTARLESPGFVPFKRLQEFEDEDEKEQLEKWAEENNEKMGAHVKIKYDRLYLLVTFGEKPTGGYRVEVRKIEQEQDAFKATVKFEEPLPEHITTPVLSYPYDLVAVDLAEKEAPSSIILDFKGLDAERQRNIPVELKPVKERF